jgi:ribose/xylose/arabinose/galactoside ABC-type transport system permease subunit
VPDTVYAGGNQQKVVIAILAFGETMLIIAGLIDLSNGAVTNIVNTDVVCRLFTKDNIAGLIAIHKRTGALN